MSDVFDERLLTLIQPDDKPYGNCGPAIARSKAGRFKYYCLICSDSAYIEDGKFKGGLHEIGRPDRHCTSACHIRKLYMFFTEVPQLPFYKCPVEGCTEKLLPRKDSLNTHCNRAHGMSLWSVVVERYPHLDGAPAGSVRNDAMLPFIQVAHTPEPPRARSERGPAQGREPMQNQAGASSDEALTFYLDFMSTFLSDANTLPEASVSDPAADVPPLAIPTAGQGPSPAAVAPTEATTSAPSVAVPVPPSERFIVVPAPPSEPFVAAPIPPSEPFVAADVPPSAHYRATDSEPRESRKRARDEDDRDENAEAETGVLDESDGHDAPAQPSKRPKTGEPEAEEPRAQSIFLYDPGAFSRLGDQQVWWDAGVNILDAAYDFAQAEEHQDGLPFPWCEAPAVL